MRAVSESIVAEAAVDEISKLAFGFTKTMCLCRGNLIQTQNESSFDIFYAFKAVSNFFAFSTEKAASNVI